MSRAMQKWLRWLALVFPVALVAFAYRHALGHGFVGDATFLIESNRYLDGAYLWENLSRNYFWSSAGNGIPYWRPLTKLSWLVQVELFGRNATLLHAALVGWHLLGVAGVQLLARTLGASWLGAALAALLYGLHPVAVEPVALLMASSDVMAATGAVWAIASWLRWRARGERAPIWLAVHVAALVLAVGSKEVGAMLAPILAVWIGVEHLARDRNEERTPFDLRALAPAWSVCIAYLGLRAWALSGLPQSPVAIDPQRIFVSVGAYLEGLLPLRISSPIRSIAFTEAADPATLLRASGAWLVLLAGVGVAVHRRAFRLLGLAAWGLLGLAPVLLVVELNIPGASQKYPLADRWALQSLAATSVACALVLRHVTVSSWTPAVATAAVLGWSVAIVSGAGAAHRVYRNDLAYFDLEDAIYAEIPPHFHTVEDECRAVDRTVVRMLNARELDLALMVIRATPRVCPGERHRRFNELSALVLAERYEEAVPVVEDLLGRPAMDRRGHAHLLELAARVRLATGEPQRAEALRAEARALALH